MIQPIKDNRRANAAKKAIKALQPKACWAEAFMILMLHKTGGSLTVSLKSLEKFEALKSDNKTVLSYDKDNKTVTITAPEMIMPDKGLIVPSGSLIN